MTSTKQLEQEIESISLTHVIEHAAHLLPSQGPITAFVHHNTLHAFEEFEFCDAVVKGAKVFGCHPYLPEIRYRAKVSSGRIRPADIEAVLLDDLGDQADVLLGFLGPRIRLRQAILEYPLHDGPSVDLRWVIADSNALRAFRAVTRPETRKQFLTETRQWVMRDFRKAMAEDPEHSSKNLLLGPDLQQSISALVESFGEKQMKNWSDSKWESFCLNLLWTISKHGAQVAAGTTAAASQSATCFEEKAAGYHRDLLFAATSEDSHELVDEILIRFCSAFVDQGFGQWDLPSRDLGFFQCFIYVYGQPLASAEPWRRGLVAELNRLDAENVTPLDSIAESLATLGVEKREQESYLQRTLLALRGFAGMLWQLETRGDRAYRSMLPGTLVQYVAIRLILERFALSNIARQTMDYRGPLAGLREFLNSKQTPNFDRNSELLRDAFRVFEIGQLLGWRPKTLARLRDHEWQMVLREIHNFPAIERRRIYHLAFERKFRNQTLDAVVLHSRRNRELEKLQAKTRPNFQIVCCLDEREESFRRAIEEVDPNCETLGTAGFFAVPIYYRGAADAHYTPLCPVMVQPRHYVREEVVHSQQDNEFKRKKARRTIGTVTHRVHVGSRTFTGGWIGTTFLGTLATFPLVARILFPRLTTYFRNVFGSLVRPPEATNLRLERSDPLPGPEDSQIGFSVKEMADCVQRLLVELGLTRNFGRIIFIAGHGSSSMNNPHEAAYDCGACGGGRGGPNARAFSQMANDSRVRDVLAEYGLLIPADTIFIGCYHNSCDDSVTCYDLDQIPSSYKAEFEAAYAKIDLARKMSAQERCRRFVSAPLNLTTETALKHVEGRSVDLSQVRPEAGHATNAICFVGSRSWSRNLFLDRRAFLQSYEPDQDDMNCSILERILQAVIPVCAGINLEYYFSYVDSVGYGCGTKLPHNITSLVGVMNGAASDLRPGLPWQMVEIHEPLRLIFVIETTPAAMQRIISANPGFGKLCLGNWVQLAVFDNQTSAIQLYKNRKFEVYTPETMHLDVAETSLDWYRGWRDHLKFSSIGPAYCRFDSSGNGHSDRIELVRR